MKVRILEVLEVSDGLVVSGPRGGSGKPRRAQSDGGGAELQERYYACKHP
jgi:hypothetical protein